MRGIWLSKAEIAVLPTSGAAWDEVKQYADQATGAANLSNQDSMANVQCLAAALVYARTGDQTALKHVKDSLTAVVGFSADTYTLGRALALGRELVAYVIAADLIDLATVDPELETNFREAIEILLTKETTINGPKSLIECQEQRPNNWGMHATASIVAVQAYLGNKPGLDRAAAIFEGWLGDRSAYAGFKYTVPMDWHADPKNPVGINPKGATKNGHSIDGVLPDDMRRGGGFPATWPPDKTKMHDSYQYEWEALQGATVAAQLLSRQGYDAWNWSDKALLRAVQFLYNINWPAESDDDWQPWLINSVYGTSFPTSIGGKPGKNMGFTAWTHATPIIVKPPVDPPPPPPPPPDPTPATDIDAAIMAVKAAQTALADTQSSLAAMQILLSQALTALGG